MPTKATVDRYVCIRKEINDAQRRASPGDPTVARHIK